MKKFFFFILISISVHAQKANENAEAMAKTQELLTNSKLRGDAIKGNPKAIQIDENLTKIGASPATKEGVYSLSAQVFERLVAEANGDPEKLQKMMDDAMKNPAAFAQKLSPGEQQKLRSLAGEIETGKARP